MSEQDVSKLDEQEPINIPSEQELEEMDNAWLDDKRDPFEVKPIGNELKTPADLTYEYQYKSVESPQPLTIAQAYSQLRQLIPNHSFNLETDVWYWQHMPEGKRLAITYRFYCLEHSVSHGGQEHESLESVLRAVREAHQQETVSEGDSRFEALRDIGELDRESSGGGPRR